LQWQPGGTLETDDYYVIRIPWGSGPNDVAEFWRKETQFQVPANYSQADVGFPDRHYNWSVQLMRCTAKCDQVFDDSIKKGGQALGSRSPEWLFYWHPDIGGGATPTPTWSP
jgi:hypothetical protein